VEELSESSFELESKYQDLETLYEQEKQKREEGDSLFKRDATKAKEQLLDVTKNYDALRKKYQEDVEQIKSVSEEEMVLKIEKIGDLEYKLKQIEDQWEISKQKWEKDQAIFKQKQEFSEFQLSEERRKNDEQKTSHENILRNIQYKERESVVGKEEASKRMQDVKDKHSEEYQELEAKFDQVRKRLGD
jgi:hypothetical protein